MFCPIARAVDELFVAVMQVCTPPSGANEYGQLSRGQQLLLHHSARASAIVRVFADRRHSRREDWRGYAVAVSMTGFQQGNHQQADTRKNSFADAKILAGSKRVPPIVVGWRRARRPNAHGSSVAIARRVGAGEGAPRTSRHIGGSSCCCGGSRAMPR